MKSDFREDMPEKVVRNGNTTFFLYHDPKDDVTKVCVYRKYTKILQVSVMMTARTVRCLSTTTVRYEDLYEVERLLKGVIPNQVLLLEVLQKAILSKEGVVDVTFEE